MKKAIQIWILEILLFGASLFPLKSSECSVRVKRRHTRCPFRAAILSTTAITNNRRQRSRPDSLESSSGGSKCTKNLTGSCDGFASHHSPRKIYTIQRNCHFTCEYKTKLTWLQVLKVIQQQTGESTMQYYFTGSEKMWASLVKKPFRINI